GAADAAIQVSRTGAMFSFSACQGEQLVPLWTTFDPRGESSVASRSSVFDMVRDYSRLAIAEPHVFRIPTKQSDNAA
ncbi:MAG: hypothetical protein WBD34_20355, partial [Burkholderiaceae bacterium]